MRGLTILVYLLLWSPVVYAIYNARKERKAKETYRFIEESGEEHYSGCVCIGCNHKPGDRIADND